MPSRNAISVGIELIRAAADSPGWSSVSILPNVMSGCCSLAAAKTGANIRHGPHQEAHQSTSVIPGLVTVSSNVSLVSAMVLMLFPAFRKIEVIYPHPYNQRCQTIFRAGVPTAYPCLARHFTRRRPAALIKMSCR